MFADLTEFHAWFERRRRAHHYEVTRTPLDQLEGWGTDPSTGDIVHHSGKFFTIRGLRVDTDHRVVKSWAQPIIVQPEIGILGIVVRIVDGEVHCLMQAKMEPGNVNLLQLSPTVQATRSNYTRVHRGAVVPYLEQFTTPRRTRTAFDALQSEQGSWFLGKRNRNIIVQADRELPCHDDFCWLTLPQIARLLQEPNLVNMDARTVLSGMPFLFPGRGIEWTGPRPPHTASGGPLHTTEQLLSWFTEVKTRYRIDRELIPLSEVPNWRRTDGELAHEERRYFTVMGVTVRASSREVAQWSQPMLAPSDRGVIAFLGRYINGAFHVLVHGRTEAGTLDVAEMSPTVNCIPSNYTGVPAHLRPRYLDVVEQATPERVLVDVVHSEEGGRFHHAENRYLVVDAGEEFDLGVPPDFCWMTLDQLTGFVCYGNHVNVAARCLLSCLTGSRIPLAAPR